MEKCKSFVFILLLIQLSSDIVFSFDENELEKPMASIVFELVDNACATIDECKYVCCQLNKIYNMATNRCGTKHIDQQLSAVYWKNPFSDDHKRSCESVCSQNITTEERVREDIYFEFFKNLLTLLPAPYWCNNFVKICYSYSVARPHCRIFKEMDYFRTTSLPIIEETLLISLLSSIMLLHLAVSELRSRIQDKCFLFYLGFRIAYFSTRLILVFSQDREILCRIYAFVLQFSGLAAAFWLNVICFHMWRCMNSVIPKFHSSARTIFHYSLYAIGCSLLITGVTHSADFWLPVKFKSFKPRINESLCGIVLTDRYLGAELWLQPQFIYYFNFQSMIQIINLGAFLHIVFILISNEKKFSQRGNETFRRHQIQQVGYFTYVKLFLLMGLTTILELLFFHLGCSTYKKSFARVMSAILLFGIFVCNKRVYCLVKNRFSQLSSSQSTTKNIGAVGYRAVMEQTRNTNLNRF